MRAKLAMWVCLVCGFGGGLVSCARPAVSSLPPTITPQATATRRPTRTPGPTPTATLTDAPVPTIEPPTTAPPVPEPEPTPTPPSSKETLVVIAADQEWQNTGVTISSGDFVRIQYISGTWTVNVRNTSLDYYVDAEGYPGYRSQNIMPDENVGTMIGKIGDGLPFAVGKSIDLSSAESGRLYLMINDGVCVECAEPLGDNDGLITMQITVEHR